MGFMDFLKKKDAPLPPLNQPKISVYRVSEISVEDAYEQVQRGVMLLDVREGFEWRAHGHVKGAKSLPIGELSLKRLPSNLDTPLMFMCESGSRSGSAARQAVAWGYRNVMNVTGGLMRWKRAGLPVAS